MASATDYLENKILDHTLGTTTYTFVAQLYIGLFTTSGTPPSDTGPGTSEVSAGNYARKTIDFNAASAGSATNSTAPTWTANALYGEIGYIGLFDASTAGNLLWWAPLNANRTVDNGDTLTIDAGNLTVSIT